tara:strand:- start:1615 stop:1800 length:186 start_codon:yes stop_codon:yes gene_type:complete
MIYSPKKINMKEILMQSTVDYLHPINPQLLDNITNGRQFEKKQIISDREENDITYFIIKDE